MSSRSELAARRAVLLARSDRQRREAAVAVDGIAHALWPIDAAEVLARRAAAHPAWVFGTVVAVVIVLRPARILKIVAWGASAALAVRRIARPWVGAESFSSASTARAAAHEGSVTRRP